MSYRMFLTQGNQKKFHSLKTVRFRGNFVKLIEVLIHCELEDLSNKQYRIRLSRTNTNRRVSQALYQNGEARSLALDISNAFDKDCIASYLRKSEGYVFSGRCFDLIQSFLSYRIFKVVLTGHFWKLNINASVCQDSIRGHAMSLTFIKAIPFPQHTYIEKSIKPSPKDAKH